MEIIVRVKESYGSQKIYPECPTAHGFTDLLGQVTLSEANLQGIKALGYAIKQAVYAGDRKVIVVDFI